MGEEAGGAPTARTITYREVVDLSHVIEPDMPRWPGDPPVRLREWTTFDRQGYALRKVSFGEHTGTHLNAAASFHKHGATTDSYTAERLVRPAVVIDAREQVAADVDYALTVDAVRRWEDGHGRVPAGSLVLLRTGWDGRWPDQEAFFNADRVGALHFPGFSVECARFLLDSREVAGLGTDSPGLDPGRDTTFRTNGLLAAHQALAVEVLARLDRLPPTGATLVIGLPRTLGGSGGPVAVTAFVP